MYFTFLKFTASYNMFVLPVTISFVKFSASYNMFIVPTCFSSTWPQLMACFPNSLGKSKNQSSLETKVVH